MIKSAFGIGRDCGDARQCVLEAVREFEDPRMILFFAGERNFREYARIIYGMFPNALCMGCSTYRTWNFRGTGKEVLNVVALEGGVVCSAGVIEKADNYALSYADNVRSCLDEVKDTENTVCVEFTVPYKRAEEYALMALNSVLLRHGIPVVGGTAANSCGDMGTSQEAYVSLNGEVYPGGCVFALIHNQEGGISFFRENIYEPLTGRELAVTKANNITRTIMTYDDAPALEVYAGELGVPLDEIRKYFFHYPMGRCVDKETFVTAIQEEGSNCSMRFHARVHEGTKMMVMKEGDYKAITRRTMEEVKDRIPNPSLVLMFHCVARTVLFEDNGYIEEYGKALAEEFPNFIGLDCLGEQFGTKNFNHTMMLVVFE